MTGYGLPRRAPTPLDDESLKGLRMARLPLRKPNRLSSLLLTSPAPLLMSQKHDVLLPPPCRQCAKRPFKPAFQYQFLVPLHNSCIHADPPAARRRGTPLRPDTSSLRAGSQPNPACDTESSSSPSWVSFLCLVTKELTHLAATFSTHLPRPAATTPAFPG